MPSGLFFSFFLLTLASRSPPKNPLLGKAAGPLALFAGTEVKRKKVSFYLFLSFFLLPHLHCHLRPLFSLFRKRRSKTYGPCFVFHAVIGMLTNQWGPKSSGLTDPKCFSLSFSFFFATSASLSSSSFPSFPFPLLARGKRQRHPHKKKPKTKQSAMMIKRQITQRTRVSDSVRPHRRR